MGVFYFEDKELPEYQNTDANKVLKVNTDGVFLQWLEDTKELPVNASFTTTAFNNGATTLNGVNLMTLNQNGPSNFNTFTPDFSQILTPSTNTGIDPPGTAYFVFGLGVNPSNGVWVVTSNTETAGETRIYVSGASNTSNYLTSWTQFTNTVINLKNLRSVVYANGIWALCSSENTTRQLYYTTDQTALTGWTQTANTGAWAVTASTTRMKFLNGQFVVLLNSSKIRVSTDCITWSEVTVNATSYNLQDIEYSPQLRRYIILTSSAGLLYYSGSSLPTSGSNMFTFVSITNGAANTISWSPKLGMFLTTPLNAPRNLINISNDGINWSQYSANGTWGSLARIGQWFNEFGGFFIIILQQTAPQCAISRDGLTWSFVSFTFSSIGNSIAFDSTSKTFMMSGTDVVHFKSVSSLFNTFVDPDKVYNTLNSNTRFRDVLEYDTQTITTGLGYNHFTPTSFTRPAINFDTTNSNANIYLQGSSFNGRIGTKFRISKTVSTNNGVRIHAYEPVKIVTPLVNMLNFNITSPITVYDFIPQTYFGSFDLTRVNDDTNEIWTGTWLVDNLNVYPLLGGTRQLGDFSVAGNLSVGGTATFNSLSISALTLPTAPRLGYRIIDATTGYTVDANCEPVIFITRSTTSSSPSRLSIPAASTLPAGLSFRVYIFNLPGRFTTLLNSAQIACSPASNNPLLFDTSNDIKYFVGNQIYSWSSSTVTYTVLDWYNWREWDTGKSRWLVTPVSKWVEPSPATTIWAGQDN
jgi:hypothetical protein